MATMIILLIVLFGIFVYLSFKLVWHTKESSLTKGLILFILLLLWAWLSAFVIVFGCTLLYGPKP